MGRTEAAVTLTSRQHLALGSGGHQEASEAQSTFQASPSGDLTGNPSQSQHCSVCLFVCFSTILLEASEPRLGTAVAGVFLKLFFFLKKEELLSSEEMSTLLFKFPEIRGRTYCQTMPLHFKTSPHKLFEDILLKVCKISY